MKFSRSLGKNLTYFDLTIEININLNLFILDLAINFCLKTTQVVRVTLTIIIRQRLESRSDIRLSRYLPAFLISLLQDIYNG